MKTLKINNFEENCYYNKLENGLEIYLIPLKNKKSYTALFGTKYGGSVLEYQKDDKKVTTPSGIAHFLEHKLFDSNDSKPFDYYSSKGADVNAYTTPDYTAYHFTASNNFKENLEFLLKWVTSFTTTLDKVKKEQGIILEEERMYRDNPDRILYECLRENVLQKDNHRIKVVGTEEDIKAITKEQIEECYHDFYRPDNMFVVVVGSFEVEEAMETIEKTLKNWKNPSSKIKKLVPDEPYEVFKSKDIKHLNVTVPKVGYSFKMNRDNFKKLKLKDYEIDNYISLILSVCFGSASSFREKLILKGLFNSVSYQITKLKKHYIIDFYATSGKPEELIEELENYLKKLKVAETDMERIKKVWISGEVRIIDNIDGTINSLVDDILEYGKYHNNKIKEIKQLNIKDLEKVLKSMDFNNVSKLIILPKQK